MTIWFIRRDDLGVSSLARELVGDDYGGIPASVIVVDAEAGRGPRLHKHPYAEVFYVIDGEATFTDGVNERVVRGSELVIVGPDQPHAFVNSGGGRLHQISVHLSSRFVTEWLDGPSEPDGR
jgi:mannose-6-phosphate isomerase-like protein (cupin superfamily)